jgi:O-antigen ligase
VTTAARAVSTRGERLLLAALAILPLAVYLPARFLGFTKLLRLGLTALAAAGLAVIVFARPRWGLYFSLFFIYSGMATLSPVNASTPVTLLVAAAVLVLLMRGDRNQLEDAAFWYANGFFVLIALQSMLVAREPMLALIGLSSYAEMLLGTYLVVQLIRTAEQLRRLAYVVFAGAVATVILGVVGLAFGIGTEQENLIGGYMLRFTGAHPNPNRAAAYMCTALPLGLFGVRTCRQPWARSAFVLGVLILIAGIFATLSRSVVIPFAVIVVAVLVREMKSRRSVLLLALLTAVGILFTPRYYWERVESLQDVASGGTRDWSVYTRWLAMTTAWELFLEHPLTGVGLGNFVVAGAYRLFLRMVVHNSFLEILVGTGIPGLVAYLWMLGAGVRGAFDGARHRWKTQPEWIRSLCFYLCLSAVSIWLSALFGTMPFRFPVWMPVAAGLVAGNLLRRDRAEAATA